MALGLAVLIRPDGLNLAAAFFGVLGLEKLRRPRLSPEVKRLLKLTLPEQDGAHEVLLDHPRVVAITEQINTEIAASQAEPA